MALNQACVGSGLFVDDDGILKPLVDNDTIRVTTGPRGDTLSVGYKPFLSSEWPWGANPSFGQRVYEHNGRLYTNPTNTVRFIQNVDAIPHWGTLDDLGATYRFARVAVGNTDPLRRNIFVRFTCHWDGYNIHLAPGAKSAFVAQTQRNNEPWSDAGGILSKHHNLHASAAQDISVGHISQEVITPALAFGQETSVAIRWRIHPSPNEHYTPPTRSIVGGFYACSVSATIFTLD